MCKKLINFQKDKESTKIKDLSFRSLIKHEELDYNCIQNSRTSKE